MADRYWVGGTGTWNTTSTTNWSATSGGSSGASRPAATDNVFFDQAATYTVTMTGALTCLDITVSAGTVTFATGTSPSLAVSGSMSLRAGTVWNSTGGITFRASVDKTITTNGVTINASFITINQASLSAYLTLGSALTTGLTGQVFLTQGGLNLNDFTLTTGLFSSSNTNTRTLAFGTGNIVLSHTTAATVVLAMATATFFNCTGTGGFTVAAMSNTRTFQFGTTGSGWSNAPNLTFTTGASVATITTLSSFNNLNFGTTTFNPGAITVNIAGLTLSSGGTYTSLTVIAGATGTVPRLADGTIITNAKTIQALTLNHTNTAGTTTLGSAVTTALTAVGITTLTLGTLFLNGFTLTTGVFSSTGTGTRYLVTGAGFIVLSSTVTNLVLNMATATGFIYSGTTGGFSSVMSTTRTFTFGTTGGTSANAPNLTLSSGASVATLTSGSYFKTLSFGTTSFIIAATTLNVNALTLSSSGTYTNLSVAMRGTGTITNNGKAIAAFTVNSDGTATLSAALTCTTYTQTAGTINFATFNLTCSSAVSISSGQYSNTGTITCTTWTVIGSYTLNQGTITPSTSFTVSGGGIFTYNAGTLSAVPTFNQTSGTVTLGKSYALTTTGTYTQTEGTLDLAGFTLSTGIFTSTNSNTRAITFGTGNIDLTHTTAATMVMSMDTLTNFSFTGTGGFTVADMSNTRTFNVGTTGGTASNAPNLTFTSGASLATIVTNSRFNDINFGTTSFNPGAITLNVNRSLTLSSSGTYTSLSAAILGQLSGSTITSNGKSFAALTLNAAFLSVTLADALTLSGAFTLTQGTLVCGVYNVQSDTFASTGTSTRSITGSGTYTITGSGATAFSNASAAGITMSGFTISMTSASAKTFAGGGGTYPTLNQGGAGALTISGNNSFADLTATTRPSTITFTISTTQTFTAFTLSGTAGNLVTINSSTPGSQATLSKSSGTISVDYLSIQDCLATGGATWYAGANSTNVSNNSGWIFTAPPSPSTNTGNFFLFF